MNTERLPSTPTIQNWYQAEADALYSIAIIAGLTFPGSLVGALLVGGLWHLTREPVGQKVVIAATGLAAAVAAQAIRLGWLWHLTLTAILPAQPSLPWQALVRSAEAEALLGPALLLTLQIRKRLPAANALGPDRL